MTVSVISTVKGVMIARMSRYQRLASYARRDPILYRCGYGMAALFMTLGALDAISTNWALEVGAYEINGFMRKIQEWLGYFWYIPKLFLQAIVASMLVWSPNRITLFIMAVMSGWTASVVINNFYIAYELSN